MKKCVKASFWWLMVTWFGSALDSGRGQGFVLVGGDHVVRPGPRLGLGLGFGVWFYRRKIGETRLWLQLQRFSGCSVSTAGWPYLYFRPRTRLAEAYRQAVLSVGEARNWGGGGLVVLPLGPEFGQQLWAFSAHSIELLTR